MNNINSVVSNVYVINTIIPTISPVVTVTPYKAINISRGGITRQKDEKLITEPVVKADDDKGKVDFKYIRSFMGNITQYTLDPKECSKLPSHPYFGFGACGIRVIEGTSVAMGKQIPFYTKIRIEGINNIYINHDSGNGVGRTGVDIFTNNKQQALKWGRQFRKVYILEWGKKSK